MSTLLKGAAMNFKYEIANMDVTGENNAVIRLHYRVSAQKNNCDLIPVRSGIVELSQTTENFVPFEEISKALAIQWLKEKLDCEQIEQSLTEEIENYQPISMPVTKSKLPSTWAN